MKIIPKETYQLYSTLPSLSIQDKLSDFFQRESYKIIWNRDIGENSSLLESFHFTVSRPFFFFGHKPGLQGELKTVGVGKTEIQVVAQLDKSSKRLFIAWLCIMLFLVAISLPVIIIEFIYMESQIWTMIPILLFVSGYLGVSVTFYKRSKNLKNQLTKLLEIGREQEP